MADAKISELTALGATPADNDLIPIVDVSENPDVTKSVTFTQLMSSKFGGTGADGALNVTSGTTTINASSANIVEKNYTSINISAGAILDISNAASTGTILWLKSQGNVTIAGTIDLDGDGGAGCAVS